MAEHPHLALTGSDVDRSVSTAVRVVVADGHGLMRRSLRALLQDEQDTEVISEAHDLQSALCQVHGYRPHVLVIDLGITHGAGAETIVELRKRAPGTQLVIVSMHESPAFAQQALNCGALGFVAKDRAEVELAPAVRAAASGREYVSPRSARGLHAPRPRDRTPRASQGSARITTSGSTHSSSVASATRASIPVSVRTGPAVAPG